MLTPVDVIPLHFYNGKRDAMPVGRYYVKGTLVSEEFIDLEVRERQMRLDEIEKEHSEHRRPSHRARG